MANGMVELGYVTRCYKASADRSEKLISPTPGLQNYLFIITKEGMKQPIYSHSLCFSAFTS